MLVSLENVEGSSPVMLFAVMKLYEKKYKLKGKKLCFHILKLNTYLMLIQEDLNASQSL
jgi:hypothetical protein